MGRGSKEGNACRQTPGFWKTAHLAFHAGVRTLRFRAVIGCHKLTNKIFGLP